MPAIPNLILKRLYARGSLHNTPHGCEFSVKNIVDSGTVTRFRELEIDGTVYGAANLAVRLPDGKRIPATQISSNAPLALPAGVCVTLHLDGVTLSSGKHRLRLCFETLELGDLEFKVTDDARQSPETDDEGQGSEDERDLSPTALRPSPPVRPIKIAILGAGSAVFARQLMADLLCTPGLERGTFALVDVDGERLDLARRIAERLVVQSGRAWKVEATPDRTRALPGCDYVISLIEVAGLRNVRPDYEIPLKYGVDQCIGDTVGPGGIFKMLRTGPAWLAILRDVERLCPGALVLNYTNPMSALTLLALRATSLQVVGLCHSVQGTSRQLAAYLEIPYEELGFRCAGINHLAWFVELTWHGEDLYPRLRQAARDPEIYDCDPVRFEVMLHFGAFVTESSGHFSEYVPYFRKRPDLLARYTRQGYRGESGFYAHNWPRWRREADDTIRAQLAGRSEIVLQRSSEYASYIVEAIETGHPTLIHGNVLNRHPRRASLIDNLPAGSCVEVPIAVDGTGLHPTYFGPLPTQLAALDAAHMPIHELMVQAVLAHDRQAALHALLLDPLTAAVCSPAEIAQMFEEMWTAERVDLQAFEGRAQA